MMTLLTLPGSEPGEAGVRRSVVRRRPRSHRRASPVGHTEIHAIFEEDGFAFAGLHAQWQRIGLGPLPLALLCGWGGWGGWGVGGGLVVIGVPGAGHHDPWSHLSGPICPARPLPVGAPCAHRSLIGARCALCDAVDRVCSVRAAG